MKSINIIADFNKVEAFAFKLLFSSRDYENNIVLFGTSVLTPTEKVLFSKGYTMLKNKELVKRIKKGTISIYIFNPNFINPNNYEEALKKWKEIT